MIRQSGILTHYAYELTIKTRRGTKMRTLDVTCGIYDTEYKLTAHKDGSLTIKAPYIKWANNNGNLAFRTVKIPSGEVAEKILWCFDNQEIEMPGYDYRTVYQEIEEWCF